MYLSHFPVLRIIYAANIIVAGWVAITSLFAPHKAVMNIFTNAYPHSEYIRLLGSLWLGIAVLSLFGLYSPLQFSPVLLLQFIYKSCWLIFVAVPAIKKNSSYPKSMAIFFLIWVSVLPFVIPYRYLF